MILLTITGTVLGTTTWQTSAGPGNVFYFHYKSTLYQNDNASITLLEEANLSQPVELTPHVLDVASAIRNATTPFGTIWVGTISWISERLAEPAVINGSVTFKVWLSSNDMTPTFSGIGAGVAVLDQQNQTVGNYVYTYSYAHGNIMTVSPKEYDFSVDLDREIAAGQRLVFAVGVGSTTSEWQMKVYFDAVQYPSQAQLPLRVIVIPEFTQASVILAAATIMIVSLQKRNSPVRPRIPRRVKFYIASLPMRGHRGAHTQESGV